MDLQDEQRRTAYHESGHAVITYQLGWDIHFVAIARIDETGFNWSGAAHGSTKQSPDGAVIAYAGPLAEARSVNLNASDGELIDGNMPPGLVDQGAWKCDAAVAKSFAGPSPLGPYIARARSLIGLERVWCAVSSLACELCDPARLKKSALREIPDDVRGAILRGFDKPDRVAVCGYIRQAELVQIIRDNVLPSGPHDLQ